MKKNFFNFEEFVKLFLSLSIFLIFLDSYQLMTIPLTWIGSGLLVVLCLVISIKEQIKINSLILIILLIALVPTLFNFTQYQNSEIGITYTLVRIFSFSGFAFTLFIFSKSSDFHHLSLKILKNIFLIILFFSIYTYLAQLFNFYEPVRNRPGTGILGFDIQTNFWISGSHRLVGTFREPIFLISVLFPSFLLVHFNLENSKLFYIFSSIIFGLTKSELAVIFVLLLFFIEIVFRKVNSKTLLFSFVFLLCFFIPVKECDISPKNLECPQYVSEDKKIIDVINESEDTNTNPVINVEINEVKFEDTERLDIISFSQNYITKNSGFGFHMTNKVYTDYLVQEVNNEMYLVNRTLPNYLKVKYLSRSFGTGRYFLTYENINIQNNFLFNLFSIGMFYLILIVSIILYFLQKDLYLGMKIFIVIFTISLASIEDLLPIFGLYLALMFTMDKNENK